MKKFTLASLAALACVSVFAAEALTSANVVGYASSTVKNTEFKLFTPMFVDVGGKGYSIQDIVPIKGFTGEGIETLQFVNTDGNMGLQVTYYTPEGAGLSNGWYNEDGSRSDELISNGQSFLISCPSDEYTLQFAGQVNYTPGTLELKSGGFLFMGNATPVAIDIQEFKPLEGFLGEGTETLQMVAPDGNMGDQYTYYTQAGAGLADGWYDEGGTRVTLAINPGQGFLVSCDNSFKMRLPAVSK